MKKALALLALFLLSSAAFVIAFGDTGREQADSECVFPDVNRMQVAFPGDGDGPQCVLECPATIAGTCTPGGNPDTQCREFDGLRETIACEYDCTTAGTWALAFECTFAICENQEHCQ